MKGKYIHNGQRGKIWRTECDLVEENKTVHSVSCINDKELLNKTILIKGKFVKGKEIFWNYHRAIPRIETRFQSYIEIIDYNIEEWKYLNPFCFSLVCLNQFLVHKKLKDT